MTAIDDLDAPHCRADGRFFCPWAPTIPAEPFAVLRWRLRRLRNPWREQRRRPMGAPVTENDGSYLPRPAEPTSLTWIGQASFVLHDRGDVVLTDPHWGPRALLPKRLAPPGLPITAIPPHAFAVLSHNHYDHLDDWTVRRLPAAVEWYAPLGLGRWLRRRARGAVRELDWWESIERGRWTITCLPAQHWSNRLGVPRNSTLWCGWLLDNGERRYYFAGDSGYYHGFAEIGRRFPGIDIAFLPVGSYEPRWFMRQAHMDPAESWRAFQDLGARRLVGMHWGTFDLTDEPADLGPRVLRQMLEAKDLERVALPVVGERLVVSDLFDRQRDS